MTAGGEGCRNGHRVSRRLRADDEIRTRDIDLGKVALYQLSYIRGTESEDAADAMLPERAAG